MLTWALAYMVGVTAKSGTVEITVPFMAFVFSMLFDIGIVGIICWTVYEIVELKQKRRKGNEK